MKVAREPLSSIPMARLVAMEDDTEVGIHDGETLGYRCCECHRVDETLMQVWHAEGCQLAGEHGRKRYDSLERGHDREMRELHPDHQIIIIRAGQSDPDDGFAHGTVVGFRCEECGNSDETLSEIVHDETCSLSGEHGAELLEQQKRIVGLAD